MNGLNGEVSRGWLTLAVVVAVLVAIGGTNAGGGRVRGVAGNQGPQSGAPLGGEQLVRELGCAACHPGVPARLDLVRARAPDPSLAGRPDDAAGVFVYLQDPVRSPREIGATRMPSFHLDERESLALTLFLETRAPQPIPPSRGPVAPPAPTQSGGRAADRAFQRAKREHPDVTAAMGAAVYDALNCAGCHDTSPTLIGAAGPNLLRVGRFRDGWLAAYLKKPQAVRPYGYHPGSGSRMPDFGLTDEEADSIAALLNRQAVEASPPQFTPETLSAFARDKAKRFLRDRLSCLGCHQLDGDGGRIGPDLSGVASRLTPRAIYAMIAEPQAAMPGTIMPRQLMPEDRVNLLASYLSARTDRRETSYLSLIDRAPGAPEYDSVAGHARYQQLCTGCHGVNGEGDGYNAEFLPVRPTRHADSAYMSTRPDDTLFDGIHAGAYILNRHHRMPAFGQLLSTEEIRSLVGYMRSLCRCEGPLWSRDGRRN